MQMTCLTSVHANDRRMLRTFYLFIYFLNSQEVKEFTYFSSSYDLQEIPTEKPVTWNIPNIP